MLRLGFEPKIDVFKTLNIGKLVTDGNRSKTSNLVTSGNQSETEIMVKSGNR